MIRVRFSVPTGNFGDILAGFFAQQMGLPIDKLHCATNANNILHKFFSSGNYHKNDKVYVTFSPSMDIEVASNFERFLFYINGNNHDLLRNWMSTFNTTGNLTLDAEYLKKSNNFIVSADVSDEETLKTIKTYHEKCQYQICPHTAVGICASEKIWKRENTDYKNSVPLICLATAHPAKFGDTVQKAIGISPKLPDALAKQDGLQTNVHEIPPDAKQVKQFIIDCLKRS